MHFTGAEILLGVKVQNWVEDPNMLDNLSRNARDASARQKPHADSR
jgi:hypothetical protein